MEYFHQKRKSASNEKTIKKVVKEENNMNMHLYDNQVISEEMKGKMNASKKRIKRI